MGISCKIGFIEDDIRFHDHLIDWFHKNENVGNVLSWHSAEEFWLDRRRSEPDILFIDIGLGGMPGTELLCMLHEKYPDMKKLMLTTLSSEDVIVNTIKHGALGYILKSELEGIAEIIPTIMNGGALITPTIALRVLSMFQQDEISEKSREDIAALSVRERQILETLVTGVSRKKAAEILGIAEDTVKWHTRNIYEKLNVKNRVELVRRSGEMGIL